MNRDRTLNSQADLNTFGEIFSDKFFVKLDRKLSE